MGEEKVHGNVARSLVYVPFVGWMPAILYLIIEKDHQVRWDAVQSLLIHVFALGVFWVVIPALSATRTLMVVTNLISGVTGLSVMVGGIVLAIRAHEEKPTRVPVLSEWVDKIVR